MLDAGSSSHEMARIDFPVRAAKRFVLIAFGALAALPLYALYRVASAPDTDGTARAVGFGFAGVLLALVAIGFVVALAVVARRPSALCVRQDGLVLVHGGVPRLFDWEKVAALEQGLVRRVPAHVVVFSDRRAVAFGMGAKAQEVARQIARAAGLIWIQEPFRARRPQHKEEAT